MEFCRDVQRGVGRCDVSNRWTSWKDQRGLEGIEVALISGLVIISLLVGIPLVAGGFQAVMTSLANTLTTAAGGIN